MAKNKTWLNNIARLIKKDNGGYFLKFERPTKKDGSHIGENCFPLTIEEGDIFQAKLKRDDLKRLVDNGTLTEAQADKICDRVKFEFSLAPNDGSAKPTDKKRKSDNDGGDDEVNF